MEDPSRVYTIPNNSRSARQSTAAQGNGTAANQNRFNLINIKSTRAIFKRNDFYKRLSILLCLLILFLFIGLIVLIAKNKKSAENLCESSECLRSAANLRLSMDSNVDPCEDFYQFTCGQWSDEHPNHGWYPTFSSFRLIDERISLATLKFLKSNVSADEPGPVKGARALFQSCLNIVAADRLGYTVIHKFIEKLGLPPVPELFKTNERDEEYKFDWVLHAARIKKLMATDLVFNFAIDADIHNRSHFVLYLSSNLGESPLPSPFKSKFKLHEVALEGDESLQDEAAVDKNETVKEVPKTKSGPKLAMERIATEVVRNSTESMELDPETLELAIDIILNMTIEIHRIVHQNETDIDDIDILKYKVDKLQEITDEYFKTNGIEPVAIWKPFLEELFKGSVAHFDMENDHIFIVKSELEEIMQLVMYISTQKQIDVELYFWWKVVESMIAATTSEINEFIYKHTSIEYFAYPDIARSRSLECAHLVNTYMGIAVTYGIADKNFVNDTLPYVEQMLSDIKSAFVANVWTMDWMDMETKNAAIDKCHEMIGWIGYPDWLNNKTAIEVYYANITIVPDQFLENLMAIVSTYIPDMLAQYNEINVKQMRTDPTVVNAFHYVADNSINVPMAILTFPIYHLGLEVLNYGAIGSVLGHELTHGFDNLGRNYDKEGNMVEWWTNVTAKTFNEKTHCFIDQYNSFKYPELNMSVNGRLTLGENLADNGGVHQSFNAYQNYISKNGAEKRLPGFEDYTNEQMFFIAYGSIWCETTDTRALHDQLQHDEHSPSRNRVIGALQNSKEFADAFKCRKGSNMNPDREKCRIW